MGADKFFSDEFLRNNDYAFVGGVKEEEINEVESDFMCLIGFNLFVSDEEYVAYKKKLDLFASKQKGTNTKLNTIEEETEIKKNTATVVRL